MKDRLVFGGVAIALAAIAALIAKFAPDQVGALAVPLVGVVVVIAAYLKPPSGGEPPAPPAPPALLVLCAALALSSSACSILRPSSPLDFAKAACVAANAFLDVKTLRAACDGLEGVTDADLEKLMAANRSGAQKAGAAVCKDAGAK